MSACWQAEHRGLLAGVWQTAGGRRTRSVRDVRLFQIQQPWHRALTWADGVVLLGIVAVIYGGVRLAMDAPTTSVGPAISLAPVHLPMYAGLSLMRMTAAYLLSLLFTMLYGRMAAHHRQAGQVMLAVLDVLQSVPILSFLPVVLLSLSAVLPQRAAVELSAVVLIFTSQAWNMTFGWYQSLTTIPKELDEASACFRFNGWLRFKVLELPFGALSLIWNSMMSWAGGWFFLMAAEMFTVGQRNFRLPGLGSYLQEAANQEDLVALGWGLLALLAIIVALDQLVWRPLLAWADRFKLQMVAQDYPPTSWFYDVLRRAQLVQTVVRSLLYPIGEAIDRYTLRHSAAPLGEPATRRAPRAIKWLLIIAVGLFLAYSAWRASQLLVLLSLAQWAEIGQGVAVTTLRVASALLLALGWTLPVGVIIGTNARLARWLQPVVQITASVPATALFPALLLTLLQLPGGLNVAAVALMLMGTQWYLLFNIIAGAAAIPQDLKYVSALLRLNHWQRWRTLILPALFPYIITGAITASGGAWNASIVAEHVEFGNRVVSTVGIGATIARATAGGDYPLLLAATGAMVLVVVSINRLVWRRMYNRAEQQYRME